MNCVSLPVHGLKPQLSVAVSGYGALGSYLGLDEVLRVEPPRG